MIKNQGLLSAQHASAIRRWKLGHHVFHLQLIVMNSALHELELALTHGAWDTATTLLRQLASLYHAATASMKYASDFSPTIYDTFIRPSMAPPWLSEGFSGELNREHEAMLSILKAIRKELRRRESHGLLPDNVAKAARALWTAQARNRRHHMLICDRFVPGGRSLLKEFFDQKDADAGSKEVNQPKAGKGS